MKDQTILIVGAGEAGIGIGDLVSTALNNEIGITIEEAHKKIWYIDSQGLVY